MSIIILLLFFESVDVDVVVVVVAAVAVAVDADDADDVFDLATTTLMAKQHAEIVVPGSPSRYYYPSILLTILSRRPLITCSNSGMDGWMMMMKYLFVATKNLSIIVVIVFVYILLY